MKKRLFKSSIAARVSFLAGLLVLVTAILVYFGTEFRMARLYQTQRETRMKFLARSMSYGLKNALAASGSKDEIGQIVRGALQRAMSANPSIAGCKVRRKDGKTAYRFMSPGVDVRSLSSTTVGVFSESGRLGDITIYYFSNKMLENEKTQQVVVIGNTVASMALYYFKQSDFFQIRYLTQKIIDEDPDVLYCSVSGPDGTSMYSYHIEEYSQYLTGNVNRRAEKVSPVQPIVVQEIGWTRKHGRMVEVAVLVNDGERHLGVVRIGYSMSSLMESIARSGLVLTTMIVAATLLAFVIGIGIARNITRPLVDLTAAAKSVSPVVSGSDAWSGLDEAERDIESLSASFDRIGKVLSARGDEVGELASSFSDMIRNLHSYIRQLRLFYQKMSLTDRLFAMGQLSAGIAHEVNNPLTIISTTTQMMLKYPSLDDSLREDITTINEEIDRIAEKIKGLQSFTQESRMEFNFEDIHALLGKTLDLCRYQISKGKISLKTGFDQNDPLMVRMDPVKMRQVFLNLILNSLQAMADSNFKELSIDTAVDATGEKVEIIISDTGPGISQDHIDRIFDPFFTTKKPGSGTGLGLAISYNIVQSHGGGITVFSVIGEGASFRISLSVDGPSLKDSAS